MRFSDRYVNLFYSIFLAYWCGLMQKAQSAIEYLTTYAWALIIIVVVLIALYALGIFDLSSIAAKGQPGACQVYRAYGPGSTQLLSLQGVCTGMQPKFVASFNGANSRVAIANSPILDPLVSLR